MQHIWADILEKSGLSTEGVTLHTLRYSIAILLLLSGKCSLVEIQQILGHSRLDTSTMYLHVDGTQLRQAVEACPLARGGTLGSAPMGSYISATLALP
jgi:site-specific recombinase XerD